MNVNLISKGILSVLLLSTSTLAYGQNEADTRSILPENTQKSMLIPNLAINFQLNSTLGEKETEYYARIVEKILANLPKKITLEGEERHLLSGSKKYDSLKVVAYFPAKGEERADDPFNKITKMYNIEFELPKEKKLKRIALAANGTPETLIERQGSFQEFLAKVSTGTASVSSTIVSQDISNSVQPIVPLQTAVNSMQKNLKSPIQKPTIQLMRRINLNYFDANVDFKSAQMVDLKKFAQSVKSEKVQKIRVVTHTAPSPFSPWTEIQENRIQALMRTLKNEGVDVNGLEFSFIHMKSTYKQSIDLSF
jgi:hypothetical protein